MAFIKSDGDWTRYKFTSLEIEIALSKSLASSDKILVPNVYYGLFSHECDLIHLSKANICTEIEIKISKQDLVADSKKYHNHKDRQNKIKYLYFAMPEHMKDFHDLVPDHAGIFEIWRRKNHVGVRKVRPAKKQSDYKFTEKQRLKLLELSALRIWKLKEKLGKCDDLIYLKDDFFNDDAKKCECEPFQACEICVVR